MLDHIERLLEERNDLQRRLIKLKEFIAGPVFKMQLPNDERELLQQQRDYMSRYFLILQQRLGKFS